MLTYEEMTSGLRAKLSERRFIHSLGVMDTAVELAALYGVDETKCRTAGLLHDCAKYLSTQQMIALIAEYVIILYPGEQDYPYLLHAPAGVAVAKRDYGVFDEEILSAIRCHTVGSKNMSLLDTIIFVADYIEPNRSPFEGLEQVRQLARKDIFAAMELEKKLTRAYCDQTGKRVFTI